MEVFAMEKREETRTEKNRGGAIKFFIWGLSPFYVRPTAPPHATLLYIFYFLDGIMCAPSPYKYVLKNVIMRYINCTKDQ